jgi:hypothetical protein
VVESEQQNVILFAKLEEARSNHLILLQFERPPRLLANEVATYRFRI